MPDLLYPPPERWPLLNVAATKSEAFAQELAEFEATSNVNGKAEASTDAEALRVEVRRLTVERDMARADLADAQERIGALEVQRDRLRAQLELVRTNR